MNRLQADVDAAVRLELVGHVLTDHTWDGYVHRHAFKELIYVQKGAVTLTCGERSLRLRRGELAFVPQECDHIVQTKQPSAYIYVGFKASMVDLTVWEGRALPADQTPELLALTGQMDDMVHLAYENRESLSNAAPRLLAELLPALFSLSSAAQKRDPKEILSDKVKKYVATHTGDPIRVSDIAASLYHSPHYLGNCFAQVNNMTIKEYVLQCKMQKALWLLQNQPDSISSVAARLGYDSPHYFSKCFKQYYGVSPTKIHSK